MIIRGGRLLDLETRAAPFQDILVADGRIIQVGNPGLDAPATAEAIDAAGLLRHPGLVKAHTHGMFNLCKGMSDRSSLELLLVNAPAMIAQHSAEMKHLSTYLGAVEMLMKGCTACCDLTFGFPFATIDEMVAIGQAYIDAGMRAVVAPSLADRSFYKAIPGLLDHIPSSLKAATAQHGSSSPHDGIRMMGQLLRDWPHERDRVSLGIAPVIPLHCSDGLMTDCADLAREYAVVLHSHVAESKVQAVSSLTAYGNTMTAHLDSLGLLGPNFTVAHGVWLDDDDMRRLADNGSSVAHCAGSNMRLGCGIADARRMIELGVNLAIGTDSANCSDNQNMYEAMRYASMASNVRGPDYRRWLSSPEIIRAATQGGAYALGFGDIGKIAPGYRADIVFIDLNSTNWMPLNDPANQLVLAEDGTGPKHVIVNGAFVVKDRRHRSCNLEDLSVRVEAARERLMELTLPARNVGAALEKIVGDFCIGLARRHYHIERYAAPLGQ
ncbi:cytosine/adenosine deaminase-related metal-dependent hydrolase [Mycoplana dimorpha]|uniref:Cytosine/adenosine deaminase-related metal-dependent hydrolase n=2 Tax=Mycoplana dimorpha TaxID=28320 RepID=A0A2T5B3N3_MYCDI|nr:cytosine/adenosine deaminase-related metal-dependent hydrolase [Mycoplana dimorpha]